MMMQRTAEFLANAAKTVCRDRYVLQPSFSLKVLRLTAGIAESEVYKAKSVFGASLGDVVRLRGCFCLVTALFQAAGEAVSHETTPKRRLFMERIINIIRILRRLSPCTSAASGCQLCGTASTFYFSSKRRATLQTLYRTGLT